MSDCWHQFVQLFWWAGTPKGAVFMIGIGVVSGLIIGTILIAIEVIPSIPQIWRRVLAEDRAQRLAKQGVQPSDSHPAPPTSEVPPTTDIPPTSDI